MKSLKLLFTLCFIFALNAEAKIIPGFIITETDAFEVILQVPIGFLVGDLTTQKLKTN
jgi:hypothetical protein